MELFSTKLLSYSSYAPLAGGGRLQESVRSEPAEQGPSTGLEFGLPHLMVSLQPGHFLNQPRSAARFLIADKATAGRGGSSHESEEILATDRATVLDLGGADSRPFARLVTIGASSVARRFAAEMKAFLG